MKIMILSLPREFKDFELLAMFKPFGTASNPVIVMDQTTGKSKGFGFIEMANEAEAQAAIKALHGKKVLNNNIRVKLADK